MTMHFKFQEFKLGLLAKEVSVAISVKRKMNKVFFQDQTRSRNLLKILRNQFLIFSKDG